MKRILKSKTVPEILAAFEPFHAKLNQLSARKHFDDFVLSHPSGDKILVEMLEGLEKFMNCLLNAIGLPNNCRRRSNYFLALNSLKNAASEALVNKKAISQSNIALLHGEYVLLYKKLPKIDNIKACQIEHSSLGLSVVALWKIN